MHIQISRWIKDYAVTHNIHSLVVGVSGGIDSAVTSTLCALTGLPTYIVTIDIKSNYKNMRLAQKHIDFLKANYTNVIHQNFELSEVFDNIKHQLYPFNNEHSLVNSKARLRMLVLYQIAQNVNGIVVGTGNKIEDYGVGFFTKYGDGGVDIAPIADLYKSEVYMVAKELKILQEIIDSPPTDGLWHDNRTDEQQIGATYSELEWAMEYDETEELSDRQAQVLEIYRKFHYMNKHKMSPIPTYKKKI
jgi:NAD+ synthase